MKISIAATTGFVLGLIVQVAALLGLHESLLAQIPLITASFVFSLFLRLLASLGFKADVNSIPFLFSFSIPFFYAVIGIFFALVLKLKEG